MKTKYGYVPNHQINSAKHYLQRLIFFLLLYVDPNEQVKYQYVDVNKAFDNVFSQLIGFNKLLNEPPQMVTIMNILESARVLYNSADFNYEEYRAKILEAGSKVMKVGGRNGNYS